MNAIEAYLLARAYTNQALEGAGALKGAACQIKSITSITGGHRVTFEWEDDEGESSTETMDVMDGTNGTDGDDGVGIASITYKETDVSGNYVYTVTLTDSNSYDITCPKGPQGSTGQTGATGNGIVSIEKTSTVGLVDTYTITYTNGTTSTFTVTNGQNGENEFIGTTAEWNALTTAQKKEYDTYQLTDDYTEGKYIYLPTIYSEEEREVGVWEDGKPLYQKVFRLSSPITVGNDWTSTGITIQNAEKVVQAFGSRNDGECAIPLNAVVQSGGVIKVSKDYSTWSDTSIIVLQYTKTTDTAGSGTWTPTGQYAEHYSTDEQIIGTWIDGKTLYQKTEVLDTTIQINPTSWTTITSGAGMDKLLSVMTVGGDGTVSDGRLRWKLNNGNVQAAAVEILNLTSPTITLYYTKTA